MMDGSQVDARQPLLGESGATSEEGENVLPPRAHVAAVEGDTEALESMSVDTVRECFRGMLAMHLAAAHNQLAVMDFILKNTATEVDVRDSRGRTPLMHAVLRHAEEAIVWLIAQRADTALEDDSGFRAVHHVAVIGSGSLFALLGNLGVDVSAADAEGRTPLELAVSHDHLPLVEYLVLARGCTDEEVSGAVSMIRPGPCAFWIDRCLRFRAGCHERAPGDLQICGPAAAGCCIPWASLRFRGPELIHVEARQLSILSGVLALISGVILLWFSARMNTTLCSSLSVLSLGCTSLGFFCFFRAACVSPGRVDPLQDATRRDRYVAALERASAVNSKDAKRINWWGERAPLIHQMQIVGPPRSKYCKATRECVPVFDHYCGFLRNTVGNDNYAAFLATIVLATTSCTCLTVAAGKMILTEGALLLWMCIVAYFGTFAIMWWNLLLYHIVLAKRGVTTNEMLQMCRSIPAYMVDEQTLKYDNPFDQGGILKNMWYRVGRRRGQLAENYEEEACLLKTDAGQDLEAPSKP